MPKQSIDRPPSESASVGLAVVALLVLIACTSPSENRPNRRPSDSTESATVTTVEARSGGDQTTATANAVSDAPRPQASTSQTSIPTVRLDGIEYTCEQILFSKWNCLESSGHRAYCNGSAEPNDCSTRWYPDELDALELVEFERQSYACERFGNRCVAYDSGPPPVSFEQPDIWCEASCSYFDPEIWFELQVDFIDYFCRDAFFGFQDYDCVRALSQEPPTIIIEPDFYCSGSQLFPECSAFWYPSDLADELIVDISGSTYLCQSASGMGSSFGDFDCGRYSGGDPRFISKSDLKCSDTRGSFECDPNEYPSALEGVYFSTIDGSQHVCKETYLGSECWTYFSGSIRNSMFGLPNFYCNRSGECDRFSYP